MQDALDEHNKTNAAEESVGKAMNDDIRDMLERGWRSVQGIDETLSRGEIDQAATIVGQADRQHRHPDIAYRAFWIDVA